MTDDDDLMTWRESLLTEQDYRNDTSPIVAVAPDASVLDVTFDGGYGATNGPPVLIWTETRVYFPVSHDGSEWIDSAPRNPTAEPQEHVC